MLKEEHGWLRKKLYERRERMKMQNSNDKRKKKRCVIIWKAKQDIEGNVTLEKCSLHCLDLISIKM